MPKTPYFSRELFQFLVDLKLRSYMSWVSFSDKQACDDKMLERLVSACKKLDPLVCFLSETMKLKGL